MAQLTADTTRVFEEATEFGSVPAAASATIYAFSAVGLTGVTGRQLVAGDKFLGFATAKCDNSGGASGGEKNISLRRKGIVKLVVTGVGAATPLGTKVYASDGNTFTTVETGNSLVGEVERLVSGTTCMVRFEGIVLKNPMYVQGAASTAHANSTTETLLDKNITLPANFIQDGDVLHVVAQGIATATNSTDTLTAVLYIGGLTGTAVCTTGAVDVANNDIFWIDAYIVCRTDGATGTIVAAGTVGLGVEGTVTAKPFKLASTTIDTTAEQQIGVGLDWSVANAGNSARMDVLVVEKLNR